MENDTVWIAGCVGQGSDCEMLLPLVNEKVKAIICLGEDNDHLIHTFANVVDFMIETNSLEEAVKIAYKLSDEGDSVLFSPACRGRDEQYANYMERGDLFKDAVRQL
jgi:UDP-N-acetylmuramoylalanine--D-glutamate ligase